MSRIAARRVDRTPTPTLPEALQGFMPDRELAFASLLEQGLIHEVFAKHGSLFGGVFHTAIVIWAFLSQVLRDGKEGSCHGRRDENRGEG